MRAGTPFFGACLGSQLLAASLGARVYAGAAPEVGLLPVTLTDAALADPVFAGLPRELLTLQWHGDTFDLPDGAVALASSPAYPNQAFRWGARAYAVQFHLEVTPQMASRVGAGARVRASRSSARSGRAPSRRCCASSTSAASELRGSARRLFAQWLDAVRSPARALTHSSDTRARGRM